MRTTPITAALTRNPRKRTAQWFGIELSAYAVLCLSLVTVAWANHTVPTGIALGTWALAGPVLLMALRTIYRRQTPHRAKS